MRIAVLGAGIVGLWTAFDLTERGFDVVVYADAPSMATTSASAVAVITPLFPWSLEEQPELFEESLGWYRETLAKFRDLNREGNFMTLMPSFEFGYVDDDGREVLEKGFPASRLEQLNFTEIRKHYTNEAIRVENEPGEFDDVTFAVNFDADMVNTQKFLPHLEGILRQRGVQFERKYFESLADIESIPENYLVNCLGMFSRFLFPDVGTEMYPIRGQSHFIPMANDPPYFGVASGHHAVFRHAGGFYLGSYFLSEDKSTWVGDGRSHRKDLRTLPTTTEWELTKKFATETYPILAAAMGFDVPPAPVNEVSQVNTGVRPFREIGPVMGYRPVGSKTIVDNFGHGAHGWTIGYGATRKAVDQLMEVVSSGQ